MSSSLDILELCILGVRGSFLAGIGESGLELPDDPFPTG